jgi:hypothetical protein
LASAAIQFSGVCCATEYAITPYPHQREQQRRRRKRPEEKQNAPARSDRFGEHANDDRRRKRRRLLGNVTQSVGPFSTQRNCYS